MSTLIAQRGYRVQLFEREHFPRFHIGESLIPRPTGCSKRLNMLPKMQQSHFVKKYSVQFVNANGKLSAPFYFWDNKPHECSQTWQVVRSEFDQMMLDNAREHGVDVHEGARVLDVLLEDDGPSACGSSGEDGDRVDEVRARVVVDASGQNGLLMNRLRLRVWDPVLNKGAIWTYWKGAYRDTGRDEGATIVIQTASTRTAGSGTSRCTTTSSASASSRRSTTCSRDATDYAQTYEEEVERCPAREGARRERDAGDRAFRDEGLFLPLEAGLRRRLGARRRRVRLSRSAVLVRRAARAAVG